MLLILLAMITFGVTLPAEPYRQAVSINWGMAFALSVFPAVHLATTTNHERINTGF